MTDAHIDKQMNLFQLISRTVANLKKTGSEKITRGAIQTRIAQLDKNWEKFESGHEKLFERMSEKVVKESVYVTSDVYTSCEEQYYANRTELLDMIDSLVPGVSARESISEASSSVGHRHTRSLPRISIPKFAGKYSEWTSFHDLFQSMVGDNEDLTPVEKLHHLKTSVTGDASKLIASIPITSENYERAWQKLKARYQNKRALVNSQLELLFNLKPLSHKSAADLEKLRATVSEVLEALEALGGPVQHWDMILVYHVCRRLDIETHEAWELSLGAKTEPPTYAELNTFLEGRVRALESVVARSTHSSKPSSKQSAKSSTHAAVTATASSSRKSSPNFTCIGCGGPHYISSCNDYLQLSSERRRELVFSKNICLNCLGRHRVKECRSAKRCTKCKQRHHSTLHDVYATSSSASGPSGGRQNEEIPAASTVSRATQQQEMPAETESSRTVTYHVTPASPACGPVLLATALVKAISPEGCEVSARALMDQGSELTFVKESLVQTLRLTRRHSTITIFGIGTQKCSTTRGAVSLRLRSLLDPASEFVVEAHVVPRLTHQIPGQSVRIDVWPHLSDLDLADPTCGTPGPVDILLGANIYGHILQDEIRKSEGNAPVAQLTTLGWIISGPTAGNHTPAGGNALLCCPDRNLDMLVTDFWSQETVPSSPRAKLSQEDAMCEEHFVKTHYRDATGRYVVRLPFRDRPDDFGDSKKIAERMLQNLQRRFERAPLLRSMYTDFLREYQELGHMERVDPSEDRGDFYLPHHGVLRESSSTTKLRVVFNGSQQTCLGLSLNDCLLSGPKIQTDLTDVLLRWRKHQFVFSADVEKMYRQVVVHPEDRAVQRILWSPSPSEESTTYQLSTVTYGLSCAPFLALGTLRQLAVNEGSQYPRAVGVVERDVYVDDVLSGDDSLSGVREKIRQVDGLFSAGGFRLQKWTSNHEEVLSSVIEDARQQHVPIHFEDGPLLRALGTTWSPTTDAFVIMSHKDVIADKHVTKRSVLSLSAGLFDPLGWMAPVLITAKIFLQTLWNLELGWDTPVHPNLARKWLNFVEELRTAESVYIPRWLGTEPGAHLELHGFSDASQDALGAVVYLRVLSEDFHARCSLLTAKTKVAPLKRKVIARLELSAAVLLVHLVNRVRAALDFQEIPVHMWTDSSVTLTWIRGHPSKWKDYVGNRVALVQDVLPQAQWRHVSGKDNPADAASRGLSPTELRDYKAWWRGPEWLSYPSASWNLSRPELPVGVDLEERPVVVHAATSQPSVWNVVDRFSSLTKLVRVTAWLFRAANVLKRKNPGTLLPVLSPADLDHALNFWIKMTQRAYFRNEIEILTQGKALPNSNHLIRLSPFLDSEGMLRLGGRLRNSPLEYDAKHPLILPRKSALTSLVIDSVHRRTLHGGTQLTLSTLRHRFWILGGRAPVRSHILHCVICARHRGQNAKQLMGQLPSARTVPSRPFLNSGVDYAGPFTLKSWHGRNSKTYKSYLIVFVCFSTSAVHFELASDYSTDGFLAAYRRFAGRRGVCSTLTSDCGTNLVGADAELRRLFNASSRDFAKLRDILASDRTEWKFNPPSAPHFGGKWESAVRSAKFHIKRIVGESLLTFEEFYTFLAQVEGLLNSRPLCPLTDDPDDVSALTPGHFLTGGPINAIPEPSLTDVQPSRLSRWQRTRLMVEHFWGRWMKEYLQRLTSIYKWHHSAGDISVGSLVLIIDERYPPSKWPLARVVSLHPGADGLVRVVTVKTATGSSFKRPVVKLCPLPVGDKPNRDVDL